jgi:hypothetical protein
MYADGTNLCNRLMYCDQLCAISEGPLYLHIMQQRRHTRQHLSQAKHLSAEVHQLRNRFARPDQLQHLQPEIVRKLQVSSYAKLICTASIAAMP